MEHSTPSSPGLTRGAAEGIANQRSQASAQSRDWVEYMPTNNATTTAR